MNWQEYVAFLTGWASSSEWDCSFKRVTESGNTVFLELEERSRIGDFSNSVNSASIYEFNDAGKITRIGVYLQMALPDPEMLASYSDVETSSTRPDRKAGRAEAFQGDHRGAVLRGGRSAGRVFVEAAEDQEDRAGRAVDVDAGRQCVLAGALFENFADEAAP